MDRTAGRSVTSVNKRGPKSAGQISLRGSPLNDTVATAWTSQTTTELLNLLNVLTGLVELEPSQASLLERILAGPTVTVADLKQAGVVPPPESTTKPAKATTADDDLLSVLQETAQGSD